MNILEEIFNKVDHSSDKWRPYFEVYHRHLKHLQGTDVNLVEVGVQKGGSLDMWSQYFSEGSVITGIDVDPECAKLEYNKPNINVVIGNQADPNFWDGFLKDREIDVFIDDGGHHMNQQIVTFEKVYPKMKVGGIFIVEDTHTSYWPDYGGGLNAKGSFIEYAKSYVDVLHYDHKKEMTSDLEMRKKIAYDTLTSVHFYDSIVVFEKLGKREMQRVFSK